MTSALRLEALAPLRHNPAGSAILLDIDGTLAPIVEQPSEAQVPEGTRHLLVDIARRYGLVACISGRTASEARAMVSVGTISYIGSHGAELLRAGRAQSERNPLLEQWTRRIQQFRGENDTPDMRRRGIRVEDKGAIVAFHWRAAAEQDAARSSLDAVAARARSAGLHTYWGRKVLEVRPPVDIDKGAGVARLLEGHDMKAVLYAGDDVTDLDAFRAIAQMAQEGRIDQAVRVGVRSEEGPEEIVNEADIVVEGPAGVRELLGVLAED